MCVLLVLQFCLWFDAHIVHPHDVRCSQDLVDGECGLVVNMTSGA